MSARLSHPIDVSFIVLNWRKLEKTLAAVKSIRAQHGYRIEVIIVNNEAQPEDESQLKAVADHVIVNAENHGFARGCNEGAGIARGTYLAFVNNDAMLPKQWLNMGIEALEADSTLGVVAGGEQFSERHRYTLSRVHPRTGMVYQNTDTETGVIHTPYSYGSNLLIRKDAFDRVGGFEESYFAYYEDVDLGAKLAAHAIGSGYVADMTIGHEVGGSTGSAGSDFRNRLIQRNKYRYIVRHFSWWPVFVVWAVFHDISKFFVGNAVIVLKGQTASETGSQKRSVYRAQLKAAGWAFLQLGDLMQSRRELIRAGHYTADLRHQLSVFNAQHQPRR